MVAPFTFSRIPVIHFGAGEFNAQPDIISRMGKTILIITGAESFQSSGKKDVLERALKNKSINFFSVQVKREPSPDLVDTIVAQFRDYGIDVVCGIGGGSVIDTGKAVSAMLLHDDSVFEYLEGVGTGKQHDGVKVPFIAVPTTAGTGNEATKNAVLSEVGPEGFKKSLRHENFVPDIAVVDPELMLSCTPFTTAASGMDALSQLLESYVSARASILTDALAYDGLNCVSRNLIPACTDGGDDIEVRTGMAYAALISGITIANAGLGVVHGIASALGGLFEIPHGVVCGTLVGVWIKVTIEKLRENGLEAGKVLGKFARVGALFSDCDSKDTDLCCDRLIRKIEEWTDTLKLPLLNEYGITESDIENILDRTGNKNNPVKLDRSDIRKIIEMRLK